METAVEFKSEELADGTGYEWAKRMDGERTDLIFHFFLKTGQAEPSFCERLKAAAEASVPDDCGGETLYTEELDGHDLIVYNVPGWKMSALRSGIISAIDTNGE